MSVTERDALNTECLLEHNRLRALHGCLPLKFDSELASQARMHAEDVIGQTQFEHEQSNDYGENLALRTGKEKCILTGKQATLLWYSEIADYDFDQENQLSCGHFSQIVWKSTTHAGFGKARSSDGSKTVVVGVYMPPANFENEWCENVPPPLSGQLYLPSKKEICGTPEQHRKVIEKEKPENHAPEEKVIIITRPTENHSSERNRQKIILVRENASKRTTTNSNRNTVIEQTTEIVSLQPSEELNCTKAAKVTEIIQNGCESDTFEVQTWYDVVTGTVIEVKCWSASGIMKKSSRTTTPENRTRLREVVGSLNLYGRILVNLALDSYRPENQIA
ncbi:Golgi-associated plant pathogenesis protein 1 [Fasciola gigantica]|uniref:Golgi-associated plant pathogenesis protein 1 n=1 Tax=Fasciola gigantica TaxID=46835 RepID=A0A504YG76_FASGI|nr:Golgi-associated plant pathogenesis protein 1 [Fasciola gigantica]